MMPSLSPYCSSTFYAYHFTLHVADPCAPPRVAFQSGTTFQRPLLTLPFRSIGNVGGGLPLQCMFQAHRPSNPCTNSPAADHRDVVRHHRPRRRMYAHARRGCGLGTLPVQPCMTRDFLHWNLITEAYNRCRNRSDQATHARRAE